MTSDPSGPTPRPADGAASPLPPTPPDEVPAAVEGDWTILSVPVDAPPPGPVQTEEDPDEAGEPSAAVAAAAPVAGPPGGSIFTLEGRPAPALYLLAWLLTAGGLGMLFITLQADETAPRALLAIVSFLAIGLGLAAGAGYQVVARQDREAPLYRGPAPVLLFFVAVALTTILAGLVGLALSADTAAGFLARAVITAAMFILVVWLFVVRTGSLSWREMGWPGRGQAGRGVADLLFGAAVMIPVTFAALIASSLLVGLTGVDIPSVAPVAASSAETAAIAIGIALVAPIGEEIFFRGFSLTAWTRDLPPRDAWLRSAFFFAVVHVLGVEASSFGQGAVAAGIKVIVIFPVALVLGWLFLRRGILAAIGGHVLYNGLQVGLALLLTGSLSGS